VNAKIDITVNNAPAASQTFVFFILIDYCTTSRTEQDKNKYSCAIDSEESRKVMKEK